MLDGVQLLPDDRREALIMRFALGMDNREIARALGRSDGATKVLIHRAIKQLEEIVAMHVKAALPNFEGLLREALAPVEPPGGPRPSGWRARSRASPRWPPRSSRRGSSRRCATRATGRARPPRSWSAAPPAPALVLLRARTARAATPPRGLDGVRDAAERALRDIGRETRKLLGDR